MHMRCLTHRCSVSLLNKQLSLSLSASPSLYNRRGVPRTRFLRFGHTRQNSPSRGHTHIGIRHLCV